MYHKFIYKCRIPGSCISVHLTDLDAVKEYYNMGAIVTCKRKVCLGKE